MQGLPPKRINYREEEKKILDEILGKGVYDNRIRPSGSNGTGTIYTCSLSMIRKLCNRVQKHRYYLNTLLIHDNRIRAFKFKQHRCNLKYSLSMIRKIGLTAKRAQVSSKFTIDTLSVIPE